MAPNRRQGVILVEPDINPITRRFSVPNIANYPPLPQVRLAGQIEDDDVEIADLRIARERERLLDRIRSDPPALVGISVTFTSNGNEAIDVAAANQIRFSSSAAGQTFRMALRSPWLIPRLARAPRALRALTDPRTFLEVHRQVQGKRLLGENTTS